MKSQASELASLFSEHERLGSWYAPVFLDPETIFSKARSSIPVVQRVLDVLEPDDYSRYLSRYLSEGVGKFGSAWSYLDLLNVLVACSYFIHPKSYLEIGVRRGRSMAMVASVTPGVDLYGFDIWKDDYAGMPNPGPEFVASEMAKFNTRGSINFKQGNSHQTLPAFLKSRPEMTFDLVTVDGDHTDEGAAQDLHWVLPRISLGGALVFDDLAHPLHPNLHDVWMKSLLASGLKFNHRSYTSLGYGVGVAIRI